MAHQQLLTKNSYALFDVISALQKDIRRGNEESAMYWALELMPKYEQYLMNRLLVIVNEDIGIADPFAQVYVKTQRDTFFLMRERGDGAARLVLANIILFMCRCQKSRLADYFNCAIEQEKNTKRMVLQIPDYAFDKHTGRGRQLGRSWDHWRKEGCKLGNPGTSPMCEDTGDYENRAFERWTHNMVEENWPKRVLKGQSEVADQMTLFDEAAQN